MSTTESVSASDLNAATEKSVGARTAEIAAAPAKKAAPAKRPAKKAAAKAAPKAVTAAPARKALTPRERASKPVTSTIADYVAWLDKGRVMGSKPLTAAEKRAAGIAITLYGSYQASPERRAARGV